MLVVHFVDDVLEFPTVNQTGVQRSGVLELLNEEGGLQVIINITNDFRYLHFGECKGCS